jgi:hypothetical protein
VEIEEFNYDLNNYLNNSRNLKELEIEITI